MGKGVKKRRSVEEEGVWKNLLKMFSYIRVLNSITLVDLLVAYRLQKASLWPEGINLISWAGWAVWVG